MWVVKIGGSLSHDPSLRLWLTELREVGGGRVVIVPGGGDFADRVRQYQSEWQFDDLAAHNMCLLAMTQYGLMMQGVLPDLVIASSEAKVRRALRDALESTRELPDTNGVVNMSSTDHLGLDQRARVMVEIRDGKWVYQPH